MKLLMGFFLVFSMSTVPLLWLTDFDQASAEATKSNKMILLNFSGSDWCGPCIRMEKEIFESAVFDDYAQKYLVLLRADLKKKKKNQLSEAQVKKNEALANKYDSQGKFPYTILMNAKGEVVKEWEGFPQVTPAVFVAEINKASSVR